MNKDTQNYWFSEMGIWGSNPVETFEFGPEHHANIHEAFDYVSDWRVGEFMAYLQGKPHAFEQASTALGFEDACLACERLAEQFEEESK